MTIAPLRTALPLAFGALLASVAMPAALAQETIETSAGPVSVEVLAEGLSNPWAIGFLPDGRLLVTEKSGDLRVVGEDGAGEPIAGVPEVVTRGQGGLLDVVVAPDFAQTGKIFMTFSEPAADAGQQEGAGTAVYAARLVLEGDSGTLEDGEVIFRMNKFTTAGQHFGSRIVIAPDGNLLVTLGERGDRDRAQDMADLAGAVVRIAPDGSVPADNPWVDQEGVAPELYSKGHRNPQGAALRADGTYFTVEHGAMGGDEINTPQPGLNYGWPVITYGVDYTREPIGEGTEKEGYEQPIHYWDPSIAPSGMAFVGGELFPDWEGDLLIGSLKFQYLARLDVDGDTIGQEERLLEGQYGRIRDVRVGPDGAIYVATDENPGQVLKLTPAE